jgi:simple sugar transport system permease protein
MILSIAFFAVFAGGRHFLTLNGTASWMDEAAELAIVAIPVALLLIAGEFDLSLASVLSMSRLPRQVVKSDTGGVERAEF